MDKIPKLPHGQGSISEWKDGYRYRKRIKFSDGSYTDHTEYGKTVKEIMAKMLEYEKGAESVHKKEKIIKQTLYSAMVDWLNNYKKAELKPQSYKRLEGTIRNQIGSSYLANFSYNTISPDEFQSYINSLNDKGLSYSSIKKTYDALNAFYKYMAFKEDIKNPMYIVKMPTKENIIKGQSKAVEFFDEEDIRRFTNESISKWNTGRLKYKGGHVFAANIYMGLRIGELLALTWGDVDFENNTIRVNKTLIEYINEETHKTVFEVQESTKTNVNRFVPLNTKAKELLVEYKSHCEYIEPTDYVISTRNRKTTTNKNASDTIKRIEINAGTKVQSGSTHTIRHTCASLYFRNGVQIELIAKILGHSPEVCRNTYLHFVEEQLKDATSKIQL